MANEFKINGEYASKYTGSEIEQVIAIIKQNWESLLKMPNFQQMLDQQGKNITDIYDNRLSEIDKILNRIVTNNNGFYILKPDEISMGKGHLTFTGLGGTVPQAFENSAMKFYDGVSYAPVYAFKVNEQIFSMGVHCDVKPQTAWYYGNEKLAYLTHDGCLMGACWNDFAEFRKSDETEAGRVICENGDGSLSRSYKRLQPGAMVVSDTYGFAIGETDDCKTPVAIAGRVLAYPYEDWWCFEPGQPVCAGPNGTVSMMSRREARKYPDRIIGTVSELPTYEKWGKHNTVVNGRIWIKVK